MCALRLAGVRPDYRHVRKVISPGPAVTLGEQAILKWYDVAVADAPVPPPIGVLAREGIARGVAGGRAGARWTRVRDPPPLRRLFLLPAAVQPGPATTRSGRRSGRRTARATPPSARGRVAGAHCPDVLRLGARCGLARAAGLEPLPPLGAQPRGRAGLPRGLLPRGRLSRGGPDPRPPVSRSGERVCEALNRAPVPRRSARPEPPLEIVERQARAARSVGVAEVHLAPADDERVRRRAIGLQRRHRGVGRAFRQERDVERRGIEAGVLREERILRGDDCEVARRADDDADLKRERSSIAAATAAAAARSGSPERKRTLPLCRIVETSPRPRAVRALRNSDMGSRFLPATLTARSSAT